jgi:hypothetical protein
MKDTRNRKCESLPMKMDLLSYWYRFCYTLWSPFLGGFFRIHPAEKS